MPRPIASKNKNNAAKSNPNFPPNQTHQQYYQVEPNTMYASDPYQQIAMDPNQAAQYQMGYDPPQSYQQQGYPQQGYPHNGYSMMTDPGQQQQISESPKAAKAKTKGKFSLFSSQKAAPEPENKSAKVSTIPSLPPIESPQTITNEIINQVDNTNDPTGNPNSNDQSNSNEDDQDRISPDADDSRSMIDTTSGNINVVVRVRPPNALELKNGFSKVIDCANDGQTLFLSGPDGRSRALTFNRVYDQDSTQETFFNQSGIKELVSQAIEGYSISIFAFGQTGSGKSFTITGPDNQMSHTSVGIVPRALRYLFEEIIERETTGPVKSRSSFLEIYNENVYDLLNPKGNSLAIRWTAEKGFFVENLYVIDCDVLDDCLAILEEGLRNRTTASHRLNEHSSRSHSVMTIHLDSEFTDSSDGRVIQRHGKICFVDLAGSERVKESLAQGDTLTETLNINKSLLTLGMLKRIYSLGKCIAALSDPRKRSGHIPYRDSKLTKLLADSLGGNGMALMIACISPAFQNMTETVKTLRYAQSAKKIKNKPVINLDPREEMLYMLKREILGLKKENELLKNSLSSDPRYQDLLDFLSQGKHLDSLPKISRGSHGKINVLHKSSSKDVTYAAEDSEGGYDGKYQNKSTSQKSINFSRNTGNQSALEKFRKNIKFTPGLGEPKEVVHTWRNSRSISRQNPRGRNESRAGSRSRSNSASTRASVVSRSSVASRSGSKERPMSVSTRRQIIKRELSGRFDYKPVPDLKFKTKNNPQKFAPDSANQRKEKTSKSEQTYRSVTQNRDREQLDSSTESNPEDKNHENIKKSTMEREHETQHQVDNFEDLDSRDKSYSEDDEITSKSKVKKSQESKKSRNDDDIQKKDKKESKEKDTPKKEDKKHKSSSKKDSKTLVRKTSDLIRSDDDTEDHGNLPEIVKLKKKTMKDVIALEEEIKRMS